MNIFYAHKLMTGEQLYVASSEYDQLLNHQDALLYVAMLDIDGYTDWTLPTGECLNRIHVMQKYENIWSKFHLNADYAYRTNHHKNMKMMHSGKLTTISGDAPHKALVRPVRIVK